MLSPKLSRFIILFLMISLFSLSGRAEEPTTPKEDKAAVEKTDDNKAIPNPTPAKKMVINGVNIIFTGNNEALIEVNGEWVKLNTAAQAASEVTDKTAAQSLLDTATPITPNSTTPENGVANATPAPEGQPADATAKKDATDEPNPEDYYGYELVNLPTPKHYEKGAFNVHFTHRFSQSPFARSASDLFGFDSFSVSAFGFTYGVTNRLYAKIFRTPLNRTIEMGGGFQLASQSKKVPFSAAIYSSVEGRDNFNESFTTNIAGMLGRSISHYGSVFFAPTVSFKANPFPDTNPHKTDTTGSLGFGAQVNFRPTGSFIIEVVPRVGYKVPGSVTAIAFGLQKRTYRHTFTLTLSNGQGTTTSQYNVGFGSITDRTAFSRSLVVGFNIYRRFF